MKGQCNLIPLNERTKDEQRNIAIKGGIASGESRRKRKTFKEELLILLKENDTQKNISIKLIDKAMDGDIKAFEVIRDTVGEKPKDKLEVDQDKPFEVKIEVIK